MAQAPYIKVTGDTHINIRVVPTTSQLDSYNKPIWKYICDEGILWASQNLHDLLIRMGKTAGTAAILNKKNIPNDKGGYDVFTVDGKTLKELVSTPTAPQTAPKTAPQTAPQTAPKKGAGAVILDKIAELAVEIAAIRTIVEQISNGTKSEGLKDEDIPF